MIRPVQLIRKPTTPVKTGTESEVDPVGVLEEPVDLPAPSPPSPRARVADRADSNDPATGTSLRWDTRHRRT